MLFIQFTKSKNQNKQIQKNQNQNFTTYIYMNKQTYHLFSY